MVTRRTSQRAFYLRPDEITQAIFAYCLAEAATKFGIELIAWTLMVNHYHAIVHDPRGNLPRFIERLHRLMANVLNDRWGRTENLWSSTETNVVYLTTREDILRKVVYVLTNPVSADLVERVSDWEGVSSSLDYLDGTKETTHARPEYYFSPKKSVMPMEATLKVTLPRIITDHESAESWADRVRAEVAKKEDSRRVLRRQDGRKVRGWKAVVATSPFAAPEMTKAKGRDAKFRPAIAAEDKRARIEEIKRLQNFRQRHEAARLRYLDGETTVEFPAGTYKMRLLGAVCEPYPDAA